MSWELLAHEDVVKNIDKLRKLCIARKETMGKIKGVLKKKRVFSGLQKDPYLQESPGKKIKTSSFVEIPLPVSSSSIVGEPPKQQEQSAVPADNKSQIRKALEGQEIMIMRNRRMFGGLNNYLKKAESRLQSEAPKVSEKKVFVEHVLSKEKEQKQQLQEAKRKELQNELAQLNERKEANQRQMLDTQNLLLSNGYKCYASNLQHFIFTKTEPSLAWKPYTEAECTVPLLKASQAAARTKGEQIVSQANSYNQKFDFGKFLAENEKQYYHNLLARCNHNQKSFYSTSTEPTLLWLPAKLHELLTHCKLASDLRADLRLIKIEEEAEKNLKRHEPVAEDHSDEASESGHSQRQLP